jgi:hypothetical protein
VLDFIIVTGFHKQTQYCQVSNFQLFLLFSVETCFSDFLHKVITEDVKCFLVLHTSVVKLLLSDGKVDSDTINVDKIPLKSVLGE